MNKTTEAFKLSEEALLGSGYYDTTQQRKALAAIREARAEQEKQEPVAYFLDVKAGFSSKPLYEQVSDEYKNDADVFPLYAAPVSIHSESETDSSSSSMRTTVRTKDLTDDEIWGALHDKGLMEGIRAVIAKFKEKNK